MCPNDTLRGNVCGKMKVTNRFLEALKAASGAEIDEGLLSQIQASFEAIIGMGPMGLKDAEPAIKFSPTEDARTKKS